MNCWSGTSSVARILGSLGDAVKERYRANGRHSNWTSSLCFLAAGLWGYALIGASAYFLFLNQLAYRERQYSADYVPAWLGWTEHAVNVFYAVLGLPVFSGTARFLDVGFLELFGRTQTPLARITILRMALYLTTSLALLRAVLPKRTLAANATRLSSCGIAVVLLTVATTWLTSRTIPAGANAHGVLGSMYAVYVLSGCILGISAVVVGKDSSRLFLTGPRLLVAVSAFASAYLILQCSTKLYVHFPFGRTERWAHFASVQNAIALWGASGAVVSRVAKGRVQRPGRGNLAGILACAVAGGFFVGVRPLVLDARLVLGLRPDWDRLSSFRHCASLPADVISVDLEELGRSSKDQFYFMRDKSLALLVRLDAPLTEYGVALCRLCGWRRSLYVVAERTTLVHSRTVGPIPVFANTCSPGMLKLDCRQDGGSQIQTRTFRSLMSDEPPTSVPMRDICTLHRQDL